MSRTNGSILQMMDSFLSEVSQEKQAAANLDLAGDAKSTHPSANVDDKTQDATEGARSRENEADVPKTAPGASINKDESQNPAEGSEHPSDDMGTQSMDSDESAAGNVDTPKKDHSKSMSDSGPGDQTFTGNYDKAAGADIVRDMNNILADLTVHAKSAAGMPPELKSNMKDMADDGKLNNSQTQIKTEEGKKMKPTKVEGSDNPGYHAKKSNEDVVAMYKEAAEQYPQDEEAGYAAAAMLANFLVNGQQAQEKAAAANMATVDGIVKEAHQDAGAYVHFLRGYQDMMKQAEGYEDDYQNPGQGQGQVEEDPAAMGGDMGDEAALAALAGGEGGGEEMGGDLDDEQVIEALAEALDEAGVTPEELAEAVSEEGGAGEGEAMPEGGMPAGGEMPMEVAANRRASGQTKAASGKSNRETLRRAVASLVRK